MTALILLSEFRKTEIELWKPIPEFPGYDVSSLGQVRSWVKTVSKRGDWEGTRYVRVPRLRPKILKQQQNRKWLRVAFSRKCISVHRLVAKAFVPNPNRLPQVNHLNAIGADNRYPNLEWTDHAGNHEHATIHGLRKRGEGVWHKARLSESDVRIIRQLRRTGTGSAELSKMFGVARSTIKRAVNGKTWHHVG